jgi:hypothetical protein
MRSRVASHRVAGTAQRDVHATREVVLQAVPDSHRKSAVVPITKGTKFNNTLADSRGQQNA